MEKIQGKVALITGGNSGIGKATPMTGVSGPEMIQPEDIAATVLYILRLSPAVWPTEIVLPRRGAG